MIYQIDESAESFMSESFRLEINAWLREFFRREDDRKPEVTQPKTDDANVVNATNSAQTPSRRRGKSKNRFAYENDGDVHNSFSELLDHLEGTFNTLKFDDDSLSWLRRDEIIGLRKLGMHVPNPWLLRYQTDPVINVAKGYPAIMAISMTGKDDMDTEDGSYPRMLFAIRQKTLPPNVAQYAGVPYRFGEAYVYDGKLSWFTMWMVLSKDGHVNICKELLHTWGKVGKNGHVAYVHNKNTADPALISAAITKNGRKNGESLIKSAFAQMFEWWQMRDERWSVAVYKGKDRVTFGIERENSKHYFANRDKTVKAADGRAKRIIHYVREHDRDTGNNVVQVKEHIRGIREFNWNGYRCVVTAPKFNGIPSSLMTLQPEEFEGEDVPVGYIATSKLGLLLARSEEGLKANP